MTLYVQKKTLLTFPRRYHLSAHFYDKGINNTKQKLLNNEMLNERPFPSETRTRVSYSLIDVPFIGVYYPFIVCHFIYIRIIHRLLGIIGLVTRCAFAERV